VHAPEAAHLQQPGRQRGHGVLLIPASLRIAQLNQTPTTNMIAAVLHNSGQVVRRCWLHRAGLGCTLTCRLRLLLQDRSGWKGLLELPTRRHLVCETCSAHEAATSINSKGITVLHVPTSCRSTQASTLSVICCTRQCMLCASINRSTQCHRASPCRSWSLQGRRTVHTEHARAACDLLKRQQARQIPAAGTRP
jgi:hypothetical protein